MQELKNHGGMRVFGTLLSFTYFISVLPAWLAGRNLMDLFNIYLKQSETYKQVLSMNRPNAYFLSVNEILADEF